MDRFLVVLLISAATILPASAAGFTITPDLIDKSDGTVVWVSANRAIDAQGKLRAEELGEDRQRKLLKNAERNRPAPRHSASADAEPLDPCVVFTGVHMSSYEPTGSLNDLVVHADAIVSGAVVSIEQGFLHGYPGSLVRIDGEILKGQPAREVYLFYPLARIPTADGMICSNPVADFIKPRPGDRMLVFSMPAPLIVGDRMILHVDVSRELLHETQDGVIKAPKALRPGADGQPVTFDAVRTAVATNVSQLQ